MATRRAERRAETKALIARMAELRGLLTEFGLELCGFDPGVLARWPERGGSLQFDRAQWSFIEPLLKELRERRVGSAYEPRSPSPRYTVYVKIAGETHQ